MLRAVIRIGRMKSNGSAEVDTYTLSQFIGIFTGSIERHGRFIPFEGKSADGKKMGKSTFIQQPPVPKDYQNHLDGNIGLGIVPVNADGQCKFCVVDIDIYDETIRNKILSVVRELHLPFTPFLSKSGGLHLYTFFRDFIPAKDVRDIIALIVSKSGLAFIHKHFKGSSTIEISPKQKEIGKGRSGSWINLPYFNCRDTEQPMLSYLDDGDNSKWFPVTLEECVGEVELASEKVTLQYLRDVITNIPNNDIPPCLQILEILKDEARPRNDYLFNLGIMLRQKHPDSYEELLRDANQSRTDPLDEEELENTILASLAKDDGGTYTYKCMVSPNVDFCNKDECKTRKYGIGDGGYFSVIEYGQLVELKAIKPTYEWNVRVQGGEWITMEFNDESELMDQFKFRKLCVRYLHIMPNKIKPNEWDAIVASALANIEEREIEGEEDNTPENLVRMFVIDFISQRVVGTKDITQIKYKRVWYDKDIDSYIFLKRGLLEFLLMKNAQRIVGAASFNDVFKALQIRMIRRRVDQNSTRIAVCAMPAMVFDKLSVAPLFKLSELQDEDKKQSDKQIVQGLAEEVTGSITGKTEGNKKQEPKEKTNKKAKEQTKDMGIKGSLI